MVAASAVRAATAKRARRVRRASSTRLPSRNRARSGPRSSPSQQTSSPPLSRPRLSVRPVRNVRPGPSVRPARSVPQQARLQPASPRQSDRSASARIRASKSCQRARPSPRGCRSSVLRTSNGQSRRALKLPLRSRAADRASSAGCAISSAPSQRRRRPCVPAPAIPPSALLVANGPTAVMVPRATASAVVAVAAAIAAAQAVAKAAPAKAEEVPADQAGAAIAVAIVRPPTNPSPSLRLPAPAAHRGRGFLLAPAPNSPGFRFRRFTSRMRLVFSAEQPF
jgi:hypothetical protein